MEEDKLYEEDMELKKEPIGISYDKANLLDKSKKIVVRGLGENRFGKQVLYCLIDGKESRLNISKRNKNELIDLLGTKHSDWIGKKVTVSGTLWEGEIDGNQSTGVTLSFE